MHERFFQENSNNLGNKNRNPTFNCLGHQENNLHKLKNQFSCLVVKSDIQYHFFRLESQKWKAVQPQMLKQGKKI